MVKCPVEHVKQAGSDVACYPGSINDINRLTLWVYRLIIYLQITIQMLIDKREASMRVFPAVSITFRESEYMK